ncbi:MAG: hydrogenase expression/formation protein HypE [candidate division Zixibacteria bacterium RBG_16_43_9]|nr:MAG: hydrogenase expression/formation protein HypE [candidate division Zixibacteria bacterium RBG_16_43_9]
MAKKHKSGEKISLSHGAGGKLSLELITELLKGNFDNKILNRLEDSAVFELNGQKIAFTADSYVIQPIFFPGGDIGKLAVCGTTNDLSVMGAKPLYLSCSLIIEEGLDKSILEKIILSMKKTAQKAGVKIVTGDTKVVGKGSADKLFINTSGIGTVSKEITLGRERIKVGDKIIINGTIGDHATAVLSSRAGLEFQTSIKSDCAFLSDLIGSILKFKDKIKFMRDPTRGGLASVLNEMVEDKRFGALLNENKIPIREEVTGFCELLGYDPLYLANEGKVIVVAASRVAKEILKIMKGNRLGKDAEIIGEITAGYKGMVALKTRYGGTRVVDMPTGEQFPRIC